MSSSTHAPAGPHAAARTAVVWQVLSGELDRLGGPGLRVVDVGGGTGGFAVPLAQLGHHVTVVDASPDALAALTRRATEAGVDARVTAVQGDGDALADLVAPDSTDLVLCHSLLEMVDDPAGVSTALATILRPGGAASVVVANRVAAALARAINGQVDAAVELLREAPGERREPASGGGGRGAVRRRFDVAEATDLLTAAGLTVVEIHGVRVVADLVPGAVLEREHEALLAFELTAAGRSPYRDIATQLHLLARRP
ncbi:methyltransferase domain-containing protein [Luedemannella helvata]|uniref:Methyltransferase n=1 Tax=Luedemannella helvata TaxID=349315 RepID=A0ABN2K0P1_9ACTN